MKALRSLLYYVFCLASPHIFVVSTSHRKLAEVSEIHHLRGNQDARVTNDLNENVHHSYGAEIDVQKLNERKSYPTNERSAEHLSNWLLQNTFSSKVFPKMRSFQSLHLLQLSKIDQTRSPNQYHPFYQDELIGNFRKAIKDGELFTCPEHRKTSSFSSNDNNIYDAMEKAIQEFSPTYILEFSSNSVITSLTHYISNKFPSLIVIQLYYEPVVPLISGYDDNCEFSVNSFSSNNAFQISGLEADNTLTTTANGNCIQYLESYDLLINDLLPFEFEQQFGSFLCRCRLSYIPKYFSSTSSSSPSSNNIYFANWDSVDTLVTNALATVRNDDNDNHCYLDSASLFSVSSSTSYVSPVRNSYSVIFTSDRNTSFNSTESSSSEENIQSSKPVNFDWRLLQNVSFLTTSRKEFALKVLYERLFQSELASDDSINNTTVPTIVPTSSSLSSSSDSHETSSRYIFSSVTQPVSAAVTPPVDGAGAVVSSPSTSGLSNVTKSNPVESRGRRLYYTHSSSSFTSSTSSSSSLKDRLEENELEFSWKLLEEKHQILDLHSSDGSSLKGRTDEIHEKMVHIYQEYLDEDHAILDDSPTSGYFLSSSSRELHKRLYRDEQHIYQMWMKLLRSPSSLASASSSSPPTASSFFWKEMKSSNLLYFIGSKLSLVSLKISSLLTKSSSSSSSSFSRKRPSKLSQSKLSNSTNLMLLSLLTEPKKASSLYQLSKLMNVPNHLIFTPDWDDMLFYLSLLSSPERGDISIIESDILLRILSIVYEKQVSIDDNNNNNNNNNVDCSLDSFYELLSLILSISKVSYLRIPSSSSLLYESLKVLTPLCYDEYVKDQVFSFSPLKKDGILEKSLKQLKFDFNIEVKEFLSSSSSSIMNGKDVFVDETFYRISITNPSRYHPPPSLSTDRGKKISLFESKVSSNGLSLYSIMNYKLHSKQKAILFQLFINLPLWNLKDYFFLHSHDHTTGDLPFHSASNSPDQTDSTQPYLNINQLAPWNIYFKIKGKKENHLWELSVVSLSMNSQNQIISNSLISVNSQQSKPQSSSSSASSSASSSLKSSLANEIMSSQKIYEILQNEFNEHSSELANGYFSFLEHNSGIGYLSSHLSLSYPNATIFSLENNEKKLSFHSFLNKKLHISNNAICNKGNTEDSIIYQNLYESPELFRFQLLFHDLLDSFIYKTKEDLSNWGEKVGNILSSALTSFVYVPNSALVSYGMYLLFNTIYLYYDKKHQQYYSFQDPFLKEKLENLKTKKSISSVFIIHKQTSYRLIEEMISVDSSSSSSSSSSSLPLKEDVLSEYLSKLQFISSHPQWPYYNFASEWLLNSARAKKGSTSLLLSPILINDHTRHTSSRRGMISQPLFFDFPMIRCDIINMTRHVHHHYDYARDGHSRTYTMRIQVNNTETSRVKSMIIDPSSAHSVVDQKGVHLGLQPSSSSSSSSDSSLSSTVDLALGHHPSQHNIVSVRLYRDRDDFPIPYISIYGVTLITALRLGLLPDLRERLFHSFLKLSLFEDMAPWNIVLMGPVSYFFLLLSFIGYYFLYLFG
jgi:hypothetical protein